MIFLDTETCGLHGVMVLLQYAIDDGEIVLHHPWMSSIDSTIKIIEMTVEHQEGICGFNLVFDWFHICKFYTVLLLMREKIGGDKCPDIELFAALEPEARLGPCLKPVTALDLMLHARKGPYQSTMDRKNICIRRVPTPMARVLRTELEQRIKLKDLYFARRKAKKQNKWDIDDIIGFDGRVDPDFKNLTLRFAPSSALKALAMDILGKDDLTQFKDVEVDHYYRPVEAGWAPFALALSVKENAWKCQVKKSKSKKGYAWPGVVQHHIDHWQYNQEARKYASDDIVYTRMLYHHFGRPDSGDDDSILACMAASVRWRGFKLDIDGLKEAKRLAMVESVKAPKAPKRVFAYVSEVMEPNEIAATLKSTAKVVLEEIGEWKNEAGRRARECLNARKADKRIQVIDKLLIAGRFHASFKIIGTKSSRMSGADGLNPQGMDRNKAFRKLFPLADPGYSLVGGDFNSYEITIADAVYDDPKLRAQLLTCFLCSEVHSIDAYNSSESACPKCHGYVIKCCKLEQTGYLGQESKCVKCGKPLERTGREDTRRKIHGLFAMELNEGMSYSDIIATKGTEEDKYDQGKRGVFGQMYGGDYNTLIKRLGVEEEIARKADSNFKRRYDGIGKSRDRITGMFSAMSQSGGIGTKITWTEPAEYIETMGGFRRYFTLEYQICKILFGLANKIPPQWKNIKIKCVRRDREQWVFGAAMSALFAAAFNIQSQVIRAAGNHVIQAEGAIRTKRLQRNIWDIQPSGIHEWVVIPMNVHDEILCPCKPEVKHKIAEVVSTTVGGMRKDVPLIKMDWNSEMKTWACK